MLPLLIAGAVAGGLQAYGQRQAQNKQNAYLQQASQFYDPSHVNQLFGGFNPFLYGALYNQGSQLNNPYTQYLQQLAYHPGYIDPQLMNQSYSLSARRTGSDIARAGGMVGNTGGMGGIASLYPLAALAAQTDRDVNTANQYGQLSSQLARQDIGLIGGMYNEEMNRALSAAGGQAGFWANQQAPTPWSSILGNAVQGGLAAYGMMEPAQQQAGGSGGAGRQIGHQSTTTLPAMGGGGGAAASNVMQMQQKINPLQQMAPQTITAPTGGVPTSNNLGIGSNVNLR